MASLTEETIIDQKLKELAGLVEERERIQDKITKIEAVLRAVIELLDDDTSQRIYTIKLALASKPVGLTEVVKREMPRAGKVTLASLRDRLTESGFQLSGYANPLAVLYTTLSRLEEQKLIKKHESGEYEWVAIAPGQLAPRNATPAQRENSLAQAKALAPRRSDKS